MNRRGPPHTDLCRRDNDPERASGNARSPKPGRLQGTTMNSILLVLAMTAGQGPAGGYQVPPVNAPPVIPGAIGTLPRLQTGQPMPAQEPKNPDAPPDPDKQKMETGDKEEKNKEEEKEAQQEPWALMRILKGTAFGDRLDERGIIISGWTEGNYTASTANRSNLPTTFNDRANFWQMNQNFLRIDKATDPTKDRFQWGFRTEFILPGTDARFTPARGLLDRQTGDYRIDMLQAYLETFNPNVGSQGTTVRIGKFATHCSYELMQGAETPFLSRSYMFQYNPFTHTGGWAITPLNDTWTMSNGLALGSDNFIGAPARPTYLGQLKWAPKEGKTNALLNLVLTDPTYDAANNFAFYNYYGMLITHKFNDKFTGVVDSAMAHMDGIPNIGTAWWYGAATYGIYQFNSKLSTTVRNELFEDVTGFRTGSKGLYYDIAWTLAWSPVRSLIFRPFVRYDHNFDSGPFEGKHSLFTAGMDAIIRW
jgi:hypothetical protein